MSDNRDRNWELAVIPIYNPPPPDLLSWSLLPPGAGAGRLLPPQPPEHPDRAADRGDAGRGVCAGPEATGRSLIVLDEP